MKKPAVLTRLVERLRLPNQAGCVYLHAAVTTDHVNPFNYTSSDAELPNIVLSETSGNQWNTERHRFGWVSLSTLEAMARGGAWPLSVPTFDINRPVPSPSAPVESLQLPDGFAKGGVALVRITGHAGFADDTALHFSWKGNRCALRDYCHPDPVAGFHPLAPSYRDTAEILSKVNQGQAEVFRRPWPPYKNIAAWRELVRRQNGAWGLGCMPTAPAHEPLVSHNQ